MNLLDQKLLSIIVLILLGMLVAVKRVSTGSTIEVPRGVPAVRLINAFNLFFLLIVIPGSSIFLITGHWETVDPTRVTLLDPWVQPVWSLGGLMIYVFGHCLMGWALIRLGRNYQIGGTPPRRTDRIIMDGPFRVIRHPVYAAALSVSLGLAFLTQSGAIFGLFGIYFLLIIILISIEEEALLKTSPGRYRLYRQKVKKLIPLIY